MHAAAQRQAAALTALTIVLLAVLAFLTAVAAPARAEPTATVQAPTPPSTTQPTSTPRPSAEADTPAVHDIPAATMRATSNLDTYTGPGTGYDRAGVILVGTEVQVDGATDDGWYRLVDGRFAKGAFLDPVPEPEGTAAEQASMWTTAPVDARTGPGARYDQAGSLAAGTEVQVNGVTADGWYRLTDGRFVLGTYLSAWVPVPVPAELDGLRQQAEAEAAQHGVTIRWTDLPGNTAGAWTSLARDTVGVDTVALSDEVALLVVRHETAHRAIDSSCGTPTPPVAGDRYENVTDAYADLFQGGMNGFVGPDLGDGVHAQVGYGQPTPGDYDIARAIHSGRCS